MPNARNTSKTTARTQPLPRIPTGVAGLDTILQGGVFYRGIYLIIGGLGTGKTILGNQICFNHIAAGGKAVYMTLASETHADMLAYLEPMTFFDSKRISVDMHYFSGSTALKTEGLAGLFALCKRIFHEQQPSLFVLNGLIATENTSASPEDILQFVQDIHLHAQAHGCTVMMFTNTEPDHYVPSVYLIVDGLLELTNDLIGERPVRHIHVHKFRGSNYLQGRHSFEITNTGLQIYPRLEALPDMQNFPEASDERLRFGCPRFDDMLGGGVLPHTLTMLFGTPGSGKTVMGLHFLNTGAKNKEQGLYLGFYEMPPALIQTANSLGLNFEKHVKTGLIDVVWHSPKGDHVDGIIDNLLTLIREHKVERLVIDGQAGLQALIDYPERLKSFFAALSNELRYLKVTTLLAVEMRELFSPSMKMPIEDFSTLADNIFLLRQVELDSQLQRFISVSKMRGSNFDPTVRKLLISEKGADVGDTFDAVGVLTGIAQPQAQRKTSSSPKRPARRARRKRE